jgi:Raf kinase inhibitor-like YbhB/YbcL family protein
MTCLGALSWASNPKLGPRARLHGMQLTSLSFQHGAPILVQHTCDGRNVSPPLQWSDVPPATKTLALIADDPDVPMGTWVHWVIYDLPTSLSGLPEAVDRSQFVLNGACQGLNDFRHLGYGGPCPPVGRPHRYFFKLYALDVELSLPPGATKPQLERAMYGHVLAQAELMGTYQRHH